MRSALGHLPHTVRMSFRAYLRLDGWVSLTLGGSLVAFGLASGHQGAFDATVSGCMMLAGTGVFMAVRHKVPFRAPGAWFTGPPLAAASEQRPVAPRRRLAAAMLFEVLVFTVVVVGLSYLSGFWLTYVDAGVWAVAIGAIKLGPGAAAVARHETRTGTTCRVARRPLRRMLELTETRP